MPMFDSRRVQTERFYLPNLFPGACFKFLNVALPRLHHDAPSHGPVSLTPFGWSG